jgi:hypothetical protein
MVDLHLGYMWTGQINVARELVEWTLSHTDAGLGIVRTWAYRLLGIVHVLEVKAEGGAEGAVLAQAEAAFRQAIQVAQEADLPLHEAMAASELKRRVLDRSGRNGEGEALLAEAARKVEGTEEEIRKFLGRYWV